MPVEVRTAGCIAHAFSLREEFGNQGRVIFVLPAFENLPDGQAYFLHNNGAVLNTGESGFCSVPNFTSDELLTLVEAGQAIVIPERPQHRGPVDPIPLTRLP